MGVKGLWQLIKPAGKPVSLESLEGKILAIDVSIWLNKAAKGMRDKLGNQVYNAHLVLMFHRICKLLFYGVKPVFVFDGGVPELKKSTLKARREKRLHAETTKTKAKNIMLENYLQTKALETVTGEKSYAKLKLQEEEKEADIFRLAPLSHVTTSQSDSSSEGDMIGEESWLEALRSEHIKEMFDNPEAVDVDSKEFMSLPAEVKHELLTEIKDSYRRRYRRKNDEESRALPENSGDFSSFQLQNLMKRGKITHQIKSLRKEMNSSLSEQFLELHKDINFKSHRKEIVAKSLASDSKASYIFIKAVKSKEENVLFNTNLEDDYIRFKQRDPLTEQENQYRNLERIPAKFETIKSNRPVSVKFLSDDSSDEGQLHAIKKEKSDKQQESKVIETSGELSIPSKVEYMSAESDDSMHGEENHVTDEEPAENEVTLSTSPIQNKTLKKQEKLITFLSQSEDVDFQKVEEENIPDAVNHMPSSRTSESLLDVNKEIPEKKILNSEQLLSLRKPNISPEGDNVLPISGKLPDNVKIDSKHEVLLSPQSIPEDDAISEGSELLVTPTEMKEMTFADKFSDNVAKKTKEELIVMQENLHQEQLELHQDTLKLARQAATLSSEKYQDVQELLQLFGLPYLVSPMEAEAQCAQLDYSNLTDGSVTDDSDIFLFGGQTVYKNVFNQDKYTELYMAKIVKETLELDRHKLIAVAFLTGSDYTNGIPGVGGVTAMEILHEFCKEKPQESLNQLKEWMMKVKGGEAVFTPGCNLLRKLKRTELPKNFNSPTIWEAYLEPTVDKSDERFEWGIADVDAIKEFASEKFGWLGSRTDDVLTPVLQKWREASKKQKTLDKYFAPKLTAASNDVTSKRLRHVLDLMRNPDKNSDSHVNEQNKKSVQSKKKKRISEEGEPSTSTSSVYFQDEEDFVTTKTSKKLKSSRGFEIGDVITTTISSNEKVQAKKEENLLKAAAESLKPLPPFVLVTNINKAISKRLQGRGKRKMTRGKNSRAKAVLNQMSFVSDAPKPLVSSESDSD